MNRYRFFLLLGLLLLIAACGRSAEQPEVRGQIIIWHAWDDLRAETLDTLIDTFVEIFPGVTIVRTAVPPDQLIDRFRTRADMGLGPDLLIAPGDAVSLLASEGLVQDLTVYEPDTLAFFSGALVSAQHNERLYGLPIAQETMVLYYNREMVDTPATTLDELLTEASLGRGLAMTTTFYRSFWGIEAFGGKLLDTDRRIALDQGGFANWLGWLKIAQRNEGVFLGTDPVASAQLFREGRVAYYVGMSNEVHALREAMDDGIIGATPLPAGPFGPARPLLETRVIMLNASSSTSQSELALRLARFLTGVEQQTKLARQASIIPANAQVRVDARLNPATAAFLRQIQTAVALPNLPQVRDVLTQGDMVYTRVLEGIVDVTEAANELSAQVNEAHGLNHGDQMEATCTLEGTLRIWHGWEGDDRLTLYQISQRFMRTCPGVYIIHNQIASEDLLSRYIQAMEEAEAPDLMLGPNEWIGTLVEQGLLSHLDEMIPQDLAQRYLPVAWQAASSNGHLYGLPVSLCLTALYYDAEQVTNPAPTLADLLREAHAGQTVALSADMPYILWGAAAFGGMASDGQQAPVVDTEGLSDWLDWLQQASESPQVLVSTDIQALVQGFSQGETAYLIAESSLLHRLRNELGGERLRTAPLPTGPEGNSLAFLSADLLFFNPNVSARTIELALAYGLYLTGSEAQEVLAAQAARVPANINVRTDDYPAISGFLEQAKAVVLLPSDTVDAAAWQEGAELLDRWLAGQENSVDELNLFVDAVSGQGVIVPSPEVILEENGSSGQ